MPLPPWANAGDPVLSSLVQDGGRRTAQGIWFTGASNLAFDMTVSAQVYTGVDLGLTAASRLHSSSPPNGTAGIVYGDGTGRFTVTQDGYYSYFFYVNVVAGNATAGYAQALTGIATGPNSSYDYSLNYASSKAPLVGLGSSNIGAAFTFMEWLPAGGYFLPQARAVFSGQTVVPKIDTWYVRVMRIA